MRLLTLLLFTLCLLSCEKQDNKQSYNGQDSFIRISLEDTDGNDLFVNHPSYEWIDTTKIKVLYLGRLNQTVTATNSYIISAVTSDLPFKTKYICNVNVFEDVRRIAKDEFQSRTM